MIDNRAGMGGVVGSSLVARAAPDGYTLLQGGITTHGIGPHIWRVLAMQEVKDRLTGAGIDAAGGTPEDFGKFIRAEFDKWGPVVKAAGVKAN